METLVKNAADREQVKKAHSKAELQRLNELSDLKAVMSTEAGRRFMWRLLTECKTYSSIFAQNSSIYYNSGKQDVGHFLIAEISEASPELYLKMQNEQQLKTKGDS